MTTEGGNRVPVRGEPFAWLKLSKPSFEGFVEGAIPRINETAEDFLTRQRAQKFYKGSLPLQEDMSIFERLLVGGKKVRGVLTVFGFENFGGEPEFRAAALEAAVAYELFHNSLLIHDDIEDNSAIRRGEPSVHVRYSLSHGRRGGILDSESFGKAVAINTGSLGLLIARRTIQELPVPEDRKIEAGGFLDWVTETTIIGQRNDLTDISLEQLTRRQVFDIYYQKTSVYSLLGPITLGAILAGNIEDIGYIRPYGVNLGMAYQLIDDYLGLYGDEKLLGKPVGSDIREAKKTLFFVEAWERSNSNQRKFLRKIWGNSQVGMGEIAETQILMTELGVKQDVLRMADRLALKARNAIPLISKNSLATTILEELAYFVTQRNL